MVTCQIPCGGGERTNKNRPFNLQWVRRFELTDTHTRAATDDIEMTFGSLSFASVFVFFFTALYFSGLQISIATKRFCPNGRRHEWHRIKIKIEWQTNFINFAYNFRCGLNATRTTTAMVADGIGSHSLLLLSRALCFIQSHKQFYCLFDHCLVKTGCGEGTSHGRQKVYITVWSIFPLWFVHCFDSKTKFYSTRRYSSRHMHTTQSRERIEFIYEFVEWNDEHNAHNGFSFLPHANEPPPPPSMARPHDSMHCMTGIKLQTNSAHKRSQIYE